MSTVFLALVFVAELAALAGIGFGVYRLAGGGVLGVIAAAAAVGVAIAAWARFAAPKAEAPAAAALATKIVVFGGGIALLAIAGQPKWAIALGVLVVIAHLGAVLTGARLTGL